LYFKILY